MEQIRHCFQTRFMPGRPIAPINIDDFIDKGRCKVGLRLTAVDVTWGIDMAMRSTGIEVVMGTSSVVMRGRFRLMGDGDELVIWKHPVGKVLYSMAQYQGSMHLIVKRGEGMGALRMMRKVWLAWMANRGHGCITERNLAMLGWVVGNLSHDITVD